MKSLKTYTMIIFVLLFSTLLPAICHSQEINNDKSDKKEEKAEKQKDRHSVISLKKALEIAFENNHEYKVAVINKQRADREINATWGKLWPALESAVSVNKIKGDSGLSTFLEGKNRTINIAQLNFAVNPGTFMNELQISKNQYEIATEELRRVKHDLEFEVIKRYFNILLTNEIVNLNELSVELLKTNLTDVEKKFKAGSVPKYDLLQAKVKLSAEEDKLVYAKNSALISKENFNIILGVKDAIYTANTKLLENDDYIIPTLKKSEIVKSLVESALLNRPEVVQLEKVRDIATNKKDFYSSTYIWPTFYVGASYGYSHFENSETSGLSYSPWSKDFSIEVGATYRWGDFVPLSENSNRAKAEELNIKIAEENILSLKDNITISVRKSFYDLMVAVRTIKTSKENVKTAEEGLRIAWESYKAGILKNYEYIDAKVLLIDIKTQHINTIISYYTNLAELKKLTGAKENIDILNKLRQ